MSQAGSEFNNSREENNTNFRSNPQEKAQRLGGGQRGALQFSVSFSVLATNPSQPLICFRRVASVADRIARPDHANLSQFRPILQVRASRGESCVPTSPARKENSTKIALKCILVVSHRVCSRFGSHHAGAVRGAAQYCNPLFHGAFAMRSAQLAVNSISPSIAISDGIAIRAFAMASD
jgi:hypothetical protein